MPADQFYLKNLMYFNMCNFGLHADATLEQLQYTDHRNSCQATQFP